MGWLPNLRQEEKQEVNPLGLRACDIDVRQDKVAFLEAGYKAAETSVDMALKVADSAKTYCYRHCAFQDKVTVNTSKLRRLVLTCLSKLRTLQIANSYCYCY